MTGYAHQEVTLSDVAIALELRTLNSRHFELVYKVPSQLYKFEKKLKDLIQSKISRGRVELIVTYKILHDANEQALFLEEHLYKNAEEIFQKALQISEIANRGIERSDIFNLLRFQGVVSLTNKSLQELVIHEDELYALLEKVLHAVIVVKESEGQRLHFFIDSHLQTMAFLHEKIVEMLPFVQANSFTRLKERVQNLVSDVVIDEQRLLQEVVLLCDKADITEEIARFSSHLALSKEILADDEIRKSKRLEFLAQELLREANTMTSKIGVSEIQHIVVKIKSEIEKFREQIANIE
jgi:uncharacterized protein (TIGR00255 family)